MKKIIYFAAIILYAVSANGQGMFINIDDDSRSLTEEVSQKHVLKISNNESNDSPGGWVLPSIGTLNSLFIFVQFPDDNHDTTNAKWVKGESPADMKKWADEKWCENPTEGYMTHYFNEMSFNKLKFTGKTVSIISPHSRKWYLDNKKTRGFIHQEIIKEVNKKIDFAQFDNWKLLAPYYQVNEPDNIIDMIFIIWRNISDEYPADSAEIIKSMLDFKSDEADLGGKPFTVDNGKRTVNTWWGVSGNKPDGSGVTVRDYLSTDALRTCIHEFAHYLLGNNSFHSGFGFWAMLDTYGKKMQVANSFERSILGWINIKSINYDGISTYKNLKLRDYITTGDAIRIIIDSLKGEYFYIENHQNLSYWEKYHIFGNVEKGIYVIRQNNFSGNSLELISASGRYDWEVDQTKANPYGSVPPILPVFKQSKPDRVNGYHDLNYIPWRWNNRSQEAIPIYFTEDQNGKAKIDVKYAGDGNDAFRIGYNEVFSPWSNPNSFKEDRTPTPFGFKIDSLTTGVYSLDIYVNSSTEAPPSKPIGLIVSPDSISNSFKLDWQPNIEPDLSEYEISRKNGDDWKITGITKDTSFIDDSIYNVSSTGLLATDYRVRAKDAQNLYSVYSDIKSVITKLVDKITNINEKNAVKEYKLYQNYPNPFNPATTINYQIPTGGIVSLKVYDLLGREVAALVNEEKPAGSYDITLNANNFASGVYFYTIHTNNFTASKKMILLK